MENKAETLVILSPGFAADENDTACLPHIQLFVKALDEVCPGLNVVIVAFQYPYVAGEYKWHDAKVISIGGSNKGRLHRLNTWLKARAILRRLKREHHIIGLLSLWLGECALVGSRFARSHGLQHYTWIMGQDAKRSNKYVDWIKPHGDSLIALSDFIVRELKRNYGIKPAQVVPVGIDTSLFGEAPQKRDIDILGAGSLIPLKQYHLFVEAVAALKEFFPSIKTVICGKGPELGHLQELRDKLGLQHNVIFAGELPHQEVLTLMQRSKVFLHTSSYEGFGAVIAEALYAGAHVVSFSRPMDKDYRHHHVIKDMKQLHNELYKLLKNTHRGHDPVLICTSGQMAKNIISIFAD